jgi:hypothetical protein
MRRCFHCGTKTDGTDLTKVGDGEFCDPCFHALLREDSISKEDGGKVGRSSSPVMPVVTSVSLPPQTKASAHEPSRSASPSLDSGVGVARVPSRGLRCLVCNRELPRSVAITFLGGVMCPECHGEMSDELRRMPSSHASSEGAPATPVLGRPQTSTIPLNDETEGPRFTPGGQTRWCAGCERPMPGPGSYRVLDGKPYCPACVPFYFERRQTQKTLTEREIATRADPHPEGVSHCDCCGRLLGTERELHDGFLLCRACLSSDAELAVGVAKLRHRRQMTGLSSALDSKKGE